MQASTPKIDITLNFGSEKQSTQQTLAQVSICNYSDQNQVIHIKQQAKFNHQIGQEIIFLIKYTVYPGRENQALKYLEDGFQRPTDTSLMSPLQYITRRLDEGEQIESKIYAEPGAVCVQYTIKLNEEEEIEVFLNRLKELPKSNLELQLKGFVSHSLKNRTNVKVDYARFHFTQEEVKSQVLHGFLTQAGIINPQFAENPFYLTLQKTRKLHLNLKFKSFRQINKYFEEVNTLMGESNKKQEKEDFRYTVPGLFRQKVEGYAFLKNDVAWSADLTHHGQQIFMRLVKVYFKAAKKIL